MDKAKMFLYEEEIEDLIYSIGEAIYSQQNALRSLPETPDFMFKRGRISAKMVRLRRLRQKVQEFAARM